MFDFSTDLYSINDTTIILRLILAVVLGGIIGFERGGLVVQQDFELIYWYA